MRDTFIAALILVSSTFPILAAETFYVIFDKTLKGCTVVTAEPSDKSRYKVLGSTTQRPKLRTLCRHSRNVKRAFPPRKLCYFAVIGNELAVGSPR